MVMSSRGRLGLGFHCLGGVTEQSSAYVHRVVGSTVEPLHSRAGHLRGGETALLLLLLACSLGSLLQMAEGRGGRMHLTVLGCVGFLQKMETGSRYLRSAHRCDRTAPLPQLAPTSSSSARPPLTHRRVPVHPRFLLCPLGPDVPCLS